MATIAAPTAPARQSAYEPRERSPWLYVDWRSHQRWTIVDGTPINTIELSEEVADQPPLLFVHGLSGSWPNWLEQLPVFAAGRNGDSGRRPVSPGFGRRVIALDLPGFGRSPMPAEPITISGYARMLDALLGQLGVSAAAVVGNSMGGFVSAELAINFPQRVERLALVSPAGLSTYGDPRGLRTLARVRRIERVVAAYAGWVAAHSDTVAQRPGLRNAALGLIAAHPSRLPAPLAAEQLRGAGKPGFVQGLAANLEYDFSHRLGEIACPTLIVWGDRDRVITTRDAARFAELIPGARKVVFEDTGHVAMLERPAEFNALLSEFLSG
ncbi:MAG TPA: alpha/beta hydrolase [Solirubrobacteraceae bacterium]|jgi:pimeloyl-ACP methyl ester carboxylesterase|nr:alpha/beta hydrolase [Solirubrobacteraceae bacterium]